MKTKLLAFGIFLAAQAWLVPRRPNRLAKIKSGMLL